MVWNFHVGCLLTGATIVLFDGSVTGPVPESPDLLHLWRLAECEQVTVFGAGAAFYHACLKAGMTPRALGLVRLKTISSTGSPLSVDGYRWLIGAVKADIWINSVSGGTDICGAFLGGVPSLPVYAGELQARILGAAVESYGEEGQSLLNNVGELVCTSPLPSMPLRFWDDIDDRRYRESYFETFTQVDGSPVWRHGDWIKLVPRPGAIGAVIYGRSDATINRQGVRMGTSEIYRAVEAFEEIADSLVIDLEYLGRDPYMALFIVLSPGAELTPDLDRRLKLAIRSALSPRHVPNEILAVPAVPRTLTGKKLELPIKKLPLGQPLEKVVSRDILANPTSLEWYIRFTAKRSKGQTAGTS
jgi:acetoacetyl-CoA synthetase